MYYYVTYVFVLLYMPRKLDNMKLDLKQFRSSIPNQTMVNALNLMIKLIEIKSMIGNEMKSTD